MKPIVAVMAILVMAIPTLAQESGWIGISIAEQPDRGVLVRSVEANSPAEKSGLKANDVIVQFNKQEVVGVLQLTRLVNETPLGRSVDVVIRRDNRDQTLKVASEKSPFSSGKMHIQVPNVAPFRDHISDSFRSFEVITSANMTQAGIRGDSMTPQLREFFGVKAGEGVLVASVDANSAAAKAGVLAGDVITGIDGKTIGSPQEFTRELRSKTAAFSLRVVRNKQEREIRVERLSERTSNSGR
jgi:serine protease Do